MEKFEYREEEREILPLCHDRKMAVVPWSPLAGGRCRTSVKHVEEAVFALDIKLDAEEIAALEAPYVPHIKTGAF